MKVLHVFSIFSLKYGGGTVDVIYKLTQALQKRGHDVSIYTSDYLYDKDYDNVLNGVKLHTFESIFNLLPFKVQVHSFLSIFNFTPQILYEAKDHLMEFDLIHFHAQRSIFNVILYYYARKYKIPYVIDSHGSPPFGKRMGFKKLYDWAIGNKINKNCSLFIAQSEFGKQEYLKLGIPESKVKVIPLALPMEEYDNLPPKGAFRFKYSIKEPIIITWIGRINYIKGLDFLVDFFSDMLFFRDDIRFVIIGADDGYINELLAKIKELDILDHITFTGALYGKQKLSALQDSTIVVQPSRYEQECYAPLEAIMVGTPIIVARGTGSGNEVTTQQLGETAIVGINKSWIHKIKEILVTYDKSKWKTERAKEYLKLHRNMDEIIKQYEEVYACIKH